MSIVQHTVDTPYMVGPVHCYVAEGPDGLMLFDTGPPTETGRRYLEEHLDFDRLKHVMVTHCHLDHYGLARWLEERTDAVVYLPHRDHLKATMHEARMNGMFSLLADLGFPGQYLDDLKASMYRSVLFPPFPSQYRIAETDIPPELGIEVLDCPGHSQSDLVYVTGEHAITGDTLLRGIFQSPLLDVDLETGRRFNNYEAYCNSIRNLATLRTKTVLPGHRHTLESVDATLLFYIGKMLDRVSNLRPYRDLDSVAEIMRTVFASMKEAFHIYLKASEVVFMLDFLKRPDLLRASLEAIGLFDNVAEAYTLVIDT